MCGVESPALIPALIGSSEAMRGYVAGEDKVVEAVGGLSAGFTVYTVSTNVNTETMDLCQ